MRQLVILAGGKGTRLKERLGDLPKPLIPIGGKPLLEHQVELATRYGFSDILIFSCYRSDLVAATLGTGERWGIKIGHVVETTPMGTAGAVLGGWESLAERFMVMYGDTMINVDLGRMWDAHHASNAGATLLLHPNNHPFDSDLVEVDAQDTITAFHPRPHVAGRAYQNLVNAGLYVLNKDALTAFRGEDSGSPFPRAENRDVSGPIDFASDVFPKLLRLGVSLRGYNSPEFIKDIGTPARYDWACAQYDAGIIQRSSLATAQRAVFLDRDGTLIREISAQGLCAPESVELLPGAAESLHRLNQAGWRAILVTNQPVVAKGFVTETGLAEIHKQMETLLGREHAFLDRIYWCPHHPEKGFPGERTDLKVDCDCRKPKTGMIDRAVGALNIDRQQSWLIGDSTTDVQTAKNAGLRSVLVRTGYGGNDQRFHVEPDYTCANLAEAVELILAKGTT